MCLFVRKAFHDQQGYSFKSDLVFTRVLLLAVVIAQTETRMPPAFVELDEPCGSSLKDVRHSAYNSKIDYPNITPEQSRKITIRSLKHVNVALDEIISHLRELDRTITEVYPDISMMYQLSETRFDWLPDKQINWYRKEVRCMTKINKVLTVLPELSASLKNFSVTFKELSQLRGSCYARISDPLLTVRNSLMSSLYLDTRKALCVVSEGLDNFGCNIKLGTATFDSRHPDWNSNPDCTGLITQDNIVIERYRKFLATWKKIIKLVFDTTRYNRQPCKKKPKLPRCSKQFNSKIKKKLDVKSRKSVDVEVRDMMDNEVDETDGFKD